MRPAMRVSSYLPTEPADSRPGHWKDSMNTVATPLALALAAAFAAGAVQAQSLTSLVDGTSNTIAVGERPAVQTPIADGSVRLIAAGGASLTTRASVAGNVSQSNASSG